MVEALMDSVPLEEVGEVSKRTNGANGKNGSPKGHLEVTIPLYVNGQAKPQETPDPSAEQTAEQKLEALQNSIFNLWVQANEQHSQLPAGAMERERLVGSLQTLSVLGAKAGVSERMREHTLVANKGKVTNGF